MNEHIYKKQSNLDNSHFLKSVKKKQFNKVYVS